MRKTIGRNRRKEKKGLERKEGRFRRKQRECATAKKNMRKNIARYEEGGHMPRKGRERVKLQRGFSFFYLY